VGPLQLKGKAEAVAAYEVTGLGGVEGRFDVLAQRGLTRFVGRDAELARLLGAWERAAAGHGQVVSVVGEAGLGKSRLLHEFKRQLTGLNQRFQEGSSFAYGEITPYLPFIGVLRAVLGLGPATPLGDARTIVAAHLAGLEMASENAVFIHHVLGHPIEDEAFVQLSAAVVRQRTVEALRDLVLAEATVRPLALVMEDVHWIDAASQEVLSAVVEAMTEVALMVVLVHRPEFLHTRGDKASHILTKPYAERVALERLPRQQSRAMIAELFGTAAVPRDLEELIATRTDGNPLFVEELTRSLLESGDLVRRGEGYVLARPAEALRIPTTVQGVLIERVDRLDPELKSLIGVASVLGRVFAYPLLSAVTQLDGVLERQLSELEDLDFIHPTLLVPEREFSFKHVLTQEAVYGTLLRTRREAYHERAAQAIETLYPERLEEFYERLAYHYSRSPNADKALDYLELANRKAIRVSAMAEAKVQFEHAMQLLDRMPDTRGNRYRRISLLVDQHMVYVLLFQLADYLELLKRYESLAKELGDLGLLATLYKGAGDSHSYLGDSAMALEALHRSVEAAEAGDHTLAAGMAYAMLVWAEMWQGNYDAVTPWRTKALRVFEQNFDLYHSMGARVGAAWAYAQQGRWQEAVDECEGSLRLGHEHQDDSVVAFSAMLLAYTHASRGDVERAVERAELAVERAPNPGDRCYAQTFLGFVLCRSGQAARAVEVLESVGPLWEASRYSSGQVVNEIFLGEAYWRADRLEAAGRTLEAVSEQAGQTGRRFWVGSAQRLLGEVACEADRTPEGGAQAAAHLARSISVLGEIGAENELALAHAGYGRLCQQRGQTAGAREHLTRALEIFDRLGTLGEPERTRATLAELAR
jgi:tetratricopeptide (TPR) repeat protein